MVDFTTITEPEKPACYDRLQGLTSEAWGALHQLHMVESEPVIIESAKDELEELGLMKNGRITEEGKLAHDCHQDFLDPWDYETDGRIWKSCAVVATDGNGNDILLHAFGPAFDWHLGQYGFTCDAICLDGHTEPGVWVFEGSCGSVRHETMDGTEWDLEASGDWREPTEEEWDLIKENECPWDKETLPRWPEAKSRATGLGDLVFKKTDEPNQQ